MAGALLKQGGGVHLRALWGGSTLFHVDDLPFKWVWVHMHAWGREQGQG